MATVADRRTDEVYGDISLKLTWEGRCAEVGFNLEPAHWGNGYAVEAAGAVVDYLFDTLKVTRAFATSHPENIASAMVLERTGFVYEGHTRNSFWLGDENSDDWIYGQTPDDHQTWTNRKRTQVSDVVLKEIDQSKDQAVYKLKTHWTQRRLVAPMEWSFADALIPEIYHGHPMVPWYRAVHADGELVAFVMLGLETPGQSEPYLWRLLVDRLHQRRGIGRLVLDRMVEQCKAMGATTLLTSWEPGRGTPAPFYISYGFTPTGEIEDDEVMARLTF